MSGVKMIIAVLMLIAGLVLALVGASFMFYIVPQKIENAEFPENEEKFVTYGGNMWKLDLNTGEKVEEDFTVERHITSGEKRGDDELDINVVITGFRNGTGWSEYIPDLNSTTNYVVHPKELRISELELRKESGEVVEKSYSESEDVHWIFPIPVEKKDYNVWNSNIQSYSTAYYQGTEDRAGVECYLFYGEEVDYQIPNPDALSALPSQIFENTTTTLTLWEKAWVHPTTGTIVDYAKEINQFINLPDLPEIPEIVYPSDLQSTTGFEGSAVMFDQASSSFIPLDDLDIERNIITVSSEGYLITANETVEVTDGAGDPVPALESSIQVLFNATDGTHEGMGRTGHYLFPPTGVEPRDYMIWDDGFGKELVAHFTGYDNESFGDLDTLIYEIHVDNDTYLPGGKATMDMIYNVEARTGIVLNVEKHMSNWRPQDARRLPLDTAMINKTVHLNTTINSHNPVSGEDDTKSLQIAQTINCTGYDDPQFQVAKIQEKVTKYLPDGTMMGAPMVSRFGVDAVSMEYVHVEGWSTVDREGVFTFPIGLRNESGNITDQFLFFNSDLNTSLPLVLEETYEFQGREAAEYRMMVSGIEISADHFKALTGEDLKVPGATVHYACDYIYTADIDTGGILDVNRVMNITLYPPTYEFLYDNMDSMSTLSGSFMGDMLYINNSITGTDAGEGLTLINATTVFEYVNGTEAMSPGYSEFPINVSSHEILYPNGTGTDLYWMFPADPTQKDHYPMRMAFGAVEMMGLASKTDMGEGTATYTWSNTTAIPGEMFDPSYFGYMFNTTFKYIWTLDSFSGSVLSMTITMDVDTGPGGWINSTFQSTPESNYDMAVSNKVVSWAILGTGEKVLDTSTVMEEGETAMAVAKAMMTSKALMIADGVRPALELHIEFDDATRGEMIATATEMGLLLDQLPGLQQLHLMKQALEFNNNQVAHVYYKQVPEDIEGVSNGEGSVEFFADSAKETDASIQLMGTTLPLIMYVVALVLIIISIAILMSGKKEEEGIPEE